MAKPNCVIAIIHYPVPVGVPGDSGRSRDRSRRKRQGRQIANYLNSSISLPVSIIQIKSCPSAVIIPGVIYKPVGPVPTATNKVENSRPAISHFGRRRHIKTGAVDTRIGPLYSTKIGNKLIQCYARTKTFKQI